MILDLPRFIAAERTYWQELERLLTRLEDDPYTQLPVSDVARLQYLYRRAITALGKVAPYSDSQAREYLDALLVRAYVQCHPNREKSIKVQPLKWMFGTFPQAFRRRSRAFALAVALTVAGSAFGGLALLFDPNAKAVLMPFPELLGSPGDRVKKEEQQKGDRLANVKGTFAAELMTHNTQVALTTFALGATWGVGSTILLFYNGVTLGATMADYIRSGYGEFLAGWLLPHGVIEIPAILIAGQAGFVLAAALIGWNNGLSRRVRLRLVSHDVMTLAGGAAVLLVWAGIVEAFLSQYHYPVIPYGVKIAFGMAECCALTVFLLRSGRS